MNEWRPSASYEVLRQRAELLDCIRTFFAERQIVEVDTPILSAYSSTDPHLDSFSTLSCKPGASLGSPMYLQTSPEFAMKRLLASGSGPIYQICKAFRYGEVGRYHNPEFTMLEWYRPDFDYKRLMKEVDELLRLVLKTSPAEFLSYASVFEQYLQIEPHSASVDRLRACAAANRIVVSETLGEDHNAWSALLWTHLIEANLGDDGRPLFVFDYPVSQAMLARIRPGSPPIAERFEVYVKGVELANGFQELQDSVELQHRFEVDCRQRREGGMCEVNMDHRLLEAQRHGLPWCSGVAMGLDRLLMLKTGAGDLREILTFPFDRA